MKERIVVLSGKGSLITNQTVFAVQGGVVLEP